MRQFYFCKGILPVDDLLKYLVCADFVIIVCLLLFISWQDILLRIIANRNLLVLLCLLIPFIIMQQRFPNILAAVVVLVVCFPLFIFKILGGGDVKLIAVLSMAFTWQQIIDFIVVISLFGIVVAMTGLLFFRQITREQGVPYGVAISLGFIFLMPFYSC